MGSWRAGVAIGMVLVGCSAHGTDPAPWQGEKKQEPTPEPPAQPVAVTPTGGDDAGGPVPSSVATCGNVTCNLQTEFCELRPTGAASASSFGDDGTWTPAGCKAMPSACTMPGADACECLQRVTGCPQSGTVRTKCRVSNLGIGFGCSS